MNKLKSTQREYFLSKIESIATTNELQKIASQLEILLESKNHTSRYINNDIDGLQLQLIIEFKNRFNLEQTMDLLDTFKRKQNQTDNSLFMSLSIYLSNFMEISIDIEYDVIKFRESLENAATRIDEILAKHKFEELYFINQKIKEVLKIYKNVRTLSH